MWEGQEKKRKTEGRQTETHRNIDQLIHDGVAKPNYGNWKQSRKGIRTCPAPDICTWIHPVGGT